MPGKTFADTLNEVTDKCRNLDAPLAGRLQAFSDDIRALQPDFAAVMDRLVVKLQEAGAGEAAPAPGEAMPSFLLPDQKGHLLSLEELLERGPLAIAFHRGQWCPYCRINAAALAGIQAEIKSQGAELIAITPNVERFNAELASDAHAIFPVLSDMDNAYALALNLAVYVGEEKKRTLQDVGVDIARFQASDAWTLPIPATFVVGQDGRIKARFIDPDFRRRMAVEDILAALKAA